MQSKEAVASVPAGAPALNGSTGLRKTGKVPSLLDLTTKLLFVSSKGDVEGVTELLDRGCDVNGADYDGRSALHLAASEGKTDVVRMLLARGADVNALDRWGSTPLSDATHFGFEGTRKVLEAAGGKIMDSRREAVVQASVVQDWEVDPSEIDMKKSIPIGKGAFGEIRLATWRGTRVAVKTILMSLSDDRQVAKEFLDEVSLLPQLRHPNIVQFLGAVTQQKPFMLITEYLPRGDLHSIIQRRGALDPATATRFALDIARGMNYLHQHKPDPIVHRDLKPRNLLRNEAGRLKVADFGLSKLIKARHNQGMQDPYQMTGETGSYRYMAPEVFRHENYDKSVDVFSFAMIVQEMFEGQPAWKFQLAEDVAQYLAIEGARPPFKSRNYPSGMKELIKDCWAGDPKDRPNFSKVIERLEIIEQQFPPVDYTLADMRCRCNIL
jgi:hypothetical protein